METYSFTNQETTQTQEAKPDVLSMFLSSHVKFSRCMGALIGALVPVGVFLLAHYVIDNFSTINSLYSTLLVLITLGGLCFSANSVYSFGEKFFNSKGKALFFVVLAEGLMTASPYMWLSILVLGYLVTINALANSCNVTAQIKETRKAKRGVARKRTTTKRKKTIKPVEVEEQTMAAAA